MKLSMRVWDIKNMAYLEDFQTLMPDPRTRFESLAIQDDGTPIVCDRYGNFEYLDLAKYEFRIFID